MTKLMYQFIFNKVSFKSNDYFAYLFEVSTYTTRNLSENNPFLPRLNNLRTQPSIK